MSKKKSFYIILFTILFLVIAYNIIAFLFSFKGVNKLNKIERGEYSYIDNEDIREQLSRNFSKNADNMAWIYQDINNDGSKELILQKSSDMDRVAAIFAVEGSSIVTVLWDDMDAGSYYQLCENGLLHFNRYYGIYEFEQYILYNYDEEWNRVFVDGLELFYLFEEESKSPVEEYLGENLEMEKEKLYFWEFKMQNGEKKYTKLQKEEWENKFYALFGKECKGEIFKYFL